MTLDGVRLALSLYIVMTMLGCERQSAEQTARSSANRVVTLAPHLTELAFAAGAGDALVGVSAFSDFPPEASELAVISDAFTVDQEQLTLLAPDLVLAWDSGTPVRVVDELRNSGYRVETIRTRSLADIALAIERIGELTGRHGRATGVAREFQQSIDKLRRNYASRQRISVFYQISLKPLFTINGEHYIGEILSLCGGDNVFAGLSELAPSISVEAVVAENPDALFAGRSNDADTLTEWRRWPQLNANRYNNHFFVNADEIGRPATRLVVAAASICEKLDIARGNRRKFEDQRG